jgi:cation diffusion facilitator family transporter
MPDEKCISCGRRVPWYAFFGNLSLTVFKIVVGFLGGSSALIADGFHSFTDVIGTSVILVSCRISEKPADAGHPYGHGKVEFMSATFIYVVLIVLATGIFVGGVTVIVHWELKAPSVLTFLAGGVSILYNVIMYNLGQCAGKRNRSPALLANSFENRADAISSMAVVIGIVLAITVHPILDPIAACIVGVIIFVNCVVELRKSVGGLMDKSLAPDAVERIKQVVLGRRGISDVTFVRSRPIGTNYWLDIGVQVDAECPVDRAEAIAAEVRAELMRRSQHFHTVEVFLEPRGSTTS